MIATGIVRRVDDLGRVVIPREIRRTLRIKEGDPLELFTTREGEVVFKKYQPFEEMDWAKAKAIISAMYPNLQFGLYDDLGKKQAATKVTFPSSVDIDEDYNCVILNNEGDEIGYIYIEDETVEPEQRLRCSKVLKEFFSEF
jgi:AbrB family looped-hinge helix DNA binding protein